MDKKKDVDKEVESSEELIKKASQKEMLTDADTDGLEAMHD